MKYLVENRPTDGCRKTWKPLIWEDGIPVEHDEVTAKRKAKALNAMSDKYEWRIRPINVN